MGKHPLGNNTNAQLPYPSDQPRQCCQVIQRNQVVPMVRRVPELNTIYKNSTHTGKFTYDTAHQYE